MVEQREHERTLGVGGAGDEQLLEHACVVVVFDLAFQRAVAVEKRRCCTAVATGGVAGGESNEIDEQHLADVPIQRAQHQFAIVTERDRLSMTTRKRIASLRSLGGAVCDKVGKRGDDARW